MPRPVLRPLALLVALVVVAAPGVAGAQRAEQQQLREARERLGAIRHDIAEAERAADAADAELADADERLREIEQVVNDVALAVERQRVAVRAAADRLARVEDEAARTAARFGERAAVLFKQGPNLPFEVVLGSRDAQEALARSAYLRVVTRGERVSVEALEATRVAVDAQRGRLAEERDRLAGMQAEQEQVLEEVARLRESRALAAAEAREQLRLLHEEQDDLEAEQERLTQLIRQRQEEQRRRRAEERRRQEVARQAAAGAATTQVSSAGYAWPLCAPLTSGFGMRWGRLHAGIDLGARAGTPVRASRAGTVLFAEWRGAYGRLVLIDHHDGVVTAYAHLSGFAVGSGVPVDQGQTIGYVGSTGRSTGPHLHFEARVNGSPVDPRRYLPASC